MSGPTGPGPGTLPAGVLAAADLLELAHYDGQFARGQEGVQRTSHRSDASARVSASDEDAINLLTHWDKARLQEEQKRQARRSQAGLPKASEPAQLQGDYYRSSNGAFLAQHPCLHVQPSTSNLNFFSACITRCRVAGDCRCITSGHISSGAYVWVACTAIQGGEEEGSARYALAWDSACSSRPTAGSQVPCNNAEFPHMHACTVQVQRSL